MFKEKFSWKQRLFADTGSKTLNEIRGIIYAFIGAILIRTFLYHPFNIPSGSMYPTLMVGDFLFANKFVYGFSHQAYPFRPEIHKGRIMELGYPKRGDIIVFNSFKDPEKRDFIKRCVGLPGDKIQIIKGVLHINDESVLLERVEDYTWIDLETGQALVVPQYKESFRTGGSESPLIQHLILKRRPFGQGSLDNTPIFVVPEDHYFMMGDNRDNSKDSRVIDEVGFIHKDFIIGRADFLFFSSEAKWYEIDKWLPGMRLERVFTIIK